LFQFIAPPLDKDLKKKEKYNDESSLEDIVKNNYTGNLQKYIKEHLNFLYKQGIETAKEWKSLKPNQKSKYPIYLKLKLDEILCKLFSNSFILRSIGSQLEQHH
jgi:hypothetical protein